MLDSILKSNVIRWIVIIIVALVLLWLGTMILKGIGGHANIGAGVGSSGVQFNLGETKL